MSVYDSVTRIRLLEEMADQPALPVVGDEEGSICNRPLDDGELCDGIMGFEQETCSCWISAPCHHCLDSFTCLSCGYRLSDDGLCP